MHSIWTIGIQFSFYNSSLSLSLIFSIIIFLFLKAMDSHFNGLLRTWMSEWVPPTQMHWFLLGGFQLNGDSSEQPFDFWISGIMSIALAIKKFLPLLRWLSLLFGHLDVITWFLQGSGLHLSINQCESLDSLDTNREFLGVVTGKPYEHNALTLSLIPKLLLDLTHAHKNGGEFNMTLSFLLKTLLVTRK